MVCRHASMLSLAAPLAFRLTATLPLAATHTCLVHACMHVLLQLTSIAGSGPTPVEGRAADAVCAAHYAAEAVRRVLRPGTKVCVSLHVHACLSTP